MIGSPLWRIRNYGFLAFVRYIFFGFLKPDKSLSSQMPTVSLEFVAENFLHLSTFDIPRLVKQSKDNVDREIDNLRECLAKSNLPVKSVLAEGTSTSRLLILDFFTRNFDFQTYIETGTQHGLSASIVGLAASDLGGERRCMSIDVTDNNVISYSDAMRYIVLTTPVRRNFKNTCLENISGRVIFFHDSDHSYENMFEEFEFAWNHLNVSVLLSDDIDGNSAFFDFCRRNDLNGLRIMIDDGPAVGVVVR
jgi:hypothetical protein